MTALAGDERKRNGRTWAWWGVLLLLAWCPIPFGSNRPWAWSLASLSAFALLGAWAVSVALGRQPLVWRKAMWTPLLLAGLVVGWILAAALPGVGPPNPIWQLAGGQLGSPLSQRAVVSVDATFVALMRSLAYLAIFWLTFQYARNRDHAERLLIWISWTGLIVALYGLVNYFAGNTHIFWFERWIGQDDVTGTFVNRNHYATYAGFGLLCAIGIGVIAFRAKWRLSDRSQKAVSRTIECLAGRPLVYFMIALIIGMAWLQTHSRMGTAAVALGMLVMLVLMMATGLIRRNLVQWVIVFLLAFFLFQVSGDLTLKRIGETTGLDRFLIYSVVAEQIASAPYTGSGYGSFSQVFLMYRDLRLPLYGSYLAAHNSYLELAAEIGVPATIAAIAGMAWCAILCLIGIFRRRQDRIYPIIAVAATIAVGSHAMLDFSLQIPAVALTYAAILGMGVAQSWSVAQPAGTATDRRSQSEMA